ncbi:MAG TPA: contractile injection system protein, VgrG/Pvc8 family [Polyangia bacterium]|jgi:phage protein D|nr:contractile injection system protein, VgrG/Pvc8 family [Polyangia bacterium]
MADPFASVTVEGEDVTDLLSFVSVEENDSQADLATLVFADGSLALPDVLHEGLEVEIDLGRQDAHALLFRGPITGVRALFPQRGPAQVEVQAIDSLIQLSLKPVTKRWGNTSVSQVVREVALAEGLVAGTIEVVADTQVDEVRPFQQIEETSLAFLHRLADDYDCKLFVEHEEGGSDTLHFISTESLLAKDPIEDTLAFNDNVIEFSVAFDAFATRGHGRLVTTDPTSGERVEIDEALVQPTEAQWVPDAARIARAGEGAERLTGLVAKGAAKRARITDFWRLPPRGVGEASRTAADRGRALGDRARRLGQSGWGRAQGSIWLRPRRRVQIQGYGGRWSGPWYMARVRHEQDRARRTYTSSFVCTR